MSTPGIEIIETKYPTGRISSRKTYLNGQKHGPSEEWYPNGQQWYKHNYLNGLQHGLSESWYSDGQQWYRGNYLNGRRYDLFEGWYENGKQFLKRNYLNDHLHGLQQEWTEDGKLTQEYYLDGKEVTEEKFKKYLTSLGDSISQALNLNEKALGLIIAGYSE